MGMEFTADINLELAQYLARKKWQYRTNGENLQVKTCPYCNRSEWKFWINKKDTRFICNHKNTCGKKGTLITLKRDMGDLPKAGELKGKSGKFIPMEKVEKWHQKLLKYKTGLRYLEERGFTLEAIKHFKLGARKVGGIVYITIPHINSGMCHNVKRRAIEYDSKDQKWGRESGYASVLFNADAIEEYDEIVLVEAELDAISFWCAGVKNVVAFTAGAENFLPEWYDLLKGKKITTAFDPDKAGQRGAFDVARRVGFAQVKNVILPDEDANKVLVSLGAMELKATLEFAKKHEVSGVVKLQTVLQRMANRQLSDYADGIHTPWPSINSKVGKKGFRPGDLIILSARYKIGKTTFALQWQKWLSEVKKVPTLVNCLEMSTERLTDKITACFRRKDVDWIEPIDYTMTAWHLDGIPFYFVENQQSGTQKADDIFAQMSDAVKRYGIKFLVFDHLHYLCRSIKHITTEIGMYTRKFKEFAREHGCVVCLIAQPKKLGGNEINSDDLKDSVSIATDADWIILLHRDKIHAEGAADADDYEIEDDEDEQDEVLSPRTKVKLDAARFKGGGHTWLHYQGEESTFFETDKRKRPILDGFATE